MSHTIVLPYRLFAAAILFGFTTVCFGQMTNTGNLRSHVGSKIGLFGNFTNNGNFDSNEGQFWLVGSINDTLNGNNPFQVDSLVVNKTAKAHLDQVFEISTYATFSAGIITSDKTDIATEFYHFVDNAAHNGGSDASHIDGVVRKTGDDAFDFPVGDYDQIQKAWIGAPSNPTDHFTCYYREVSGHLYGYNTEFRESTLARVSTCEHWIIDRTGGTSDVNVQLDYDPNSCGIGDLCDLVVVRWDSGDGEWKNHGNGGVAGDLTSGTVANGTGCSTRQDITSFSPFTLGSTSSANALPIELLEFDVRLNEQKTVDITWSTSAEINNDFFTIEKSDDGMNWKTLTEIDGAGNSTTIKSYETIDRVPFDGQNYYRLTQTDFDGQQESFPIKGVFVEGANQTTVFPNPGKGSFVIRTNTSILDNQFDKIQVLNMNGQQVAFSVTNFENNPNLFNLNIEMVPAGMYWLVVGEEKLKLIKI